MSEEQAREKSPACDLYRYMRPNTRWWRCALYLAVGLAITFVLGVLEDSRVEEWDKEKNAIYRAPAAILYTLFWALLIPLALVRLGRVVGERIREKRG